MIILIYCVNFSLTLYYKMLSSNVKRSVAWANRYDVQEIDFESQYNLNVTLMTREKLLMLLSSKTRVCSLLDKYYNNPTRLDFAYQKSCNDYRDEMFDNFETMYLNMDHDEIVETGYEHKKSGRSFSKLKKNGTCKKKVESGGPQHVQGLVRNWFYKGRAFDVDMKRSQPNILAGIIGSIDHVPSANFDDEKDTGDEFEDALTNLDTYMKDRTVLHNVIKRLYNINSEYLAKGMITALMNGNHLEIPANTTGDDQHCNDAFALTTFINGYRLMMHKLYEVISDQDNDYCSEDQFKMLKKEVLVKFDGKKGTKEETDYVKFKLPIYFLHSYERYISYNAIELWKASPLGKNNVEYWSHDGFAVVSEDTDEKAVNDVLAVINETLTRELHVTVEFVIKPFDDSPMYANLDEMFADYKVDNLAMLSHQNSNISKFPQKKTDKIINLRKAELGDISLLISQQTHLQRKKNVDQLTNDEKCFLDFIYDQMKFTENSTQETLNVKSLTNFELYLNCLECCAKQLDIVSVNKVLDKWYMYNPKNCLWELSKDSEMYFPIIGKCFQENLRNLDNKNINSEDELGLFYPRKLLLGQALIEQKIGATSMIKDFKSIMKQLRNILFDQAFFDKLDMKKWMLPFKGNKCVDAETKTIIDRTKEHYFTKEMDYEYKHGKDIEDLLKLTGAINPYEFLRKIFPEEDTFEFIKSWIGYTLTGSVEERSCLFGTGIGSNGKSAIAEILLNCFEPFSMSISSEFMSKSNATIEKDKGKLVEFAYRFIFLNEPKTDFNLEFFKKFVEGARCEAKEFYTTISTQIKNICKLFVCANNNLIMESCVALEDRGLKIEFLSRFFDSIEQMNDPKFKHCTNKFLKDKAFPEKIKLEHNKQLFMNFFIENGMFPYVETAINNSNENAVVKESALYKKPMFNDVWKADVVDAEKKYPLLQDFLLKMFRPVSKEEFQDLPYENLVSKNMLINMLSAHNIAHVENGKDASLLKEIKNTLSAYDSQKVKKFNKYTKRGIFTTVIYDETHDMEQFPYFEHSLRSTYLDQGEIRLSESQVAEIKANQTKKDIMESKQHSVTSSTSVQIKYEKNILELKQQLDIAQRQNNQNAIHNLTISIERTKKDIVAQIDNQVRLKKELDALRHQNVNEEKKSDE